MNDFNHRLCVKIIMLYSKIKNINDKDNITKILYIDNTPQNVRTKIFNNLRKTIIDYRTETVYENYFDIPKLFIYLFLKYAFDLTDDNKLSLKSDINTKDDLYNLFNYKNLVYEHSFECQFDLLKKGVDEFDLAFIFEHPKVQLLLDKNNRVYSEKIDSNYTHASSLMD